MLIIRQIEHDWEIIQTLEKYDNVFYLIKKKTPYKRRDISYSLFSVPHSKSMSYGKQKPEQILSVPLWLFLTLQ